MRISLRKAAAILGVHHVTLKRWIDGGEGPRAFVKPGLTRPVIRIDTADLEQFQRRLTKRGQNP